MQLRSRWLVAAAVCVANPPVTAAETATGASPAAAAPAESQRADPDAPPAPAPALERLAASVSGGVSYKVRLKAAVLLGRSRDPRAAQPLLRALDGDPHYTVRAAAATALADLGEARAATALIRRIGIDDEAFVREAAARSLGRLDRAAVLPQAVASCTASDPSVRRAAVSYVLAAPSPAREPVLAKALGDIPEIAKLARRVVAELPPADRLRFLASASYDRDPGVRGGAVEAAREMKTGEAAALILGVYERDIEEETVRSVARDALRELRELLPLRQIVRDATAAPEKHARARSLRLLGCLGGPEAEKVLVAGLADPDRYVRGIAVMALGELGDPAALPAIEKLVGDPDNQPIMHLVNNTLRELRGGKGENGPE